MAQVGAAALLDTNSALRPALRQTIARISAESASRVQCRRSSIRITTSCKSLQNALPNCVRSSASSGHHGRTLPTAGSNRRGGRLRAYLGRPPPERASALPARPQRLRTPRLPSVPSVALLNCLSIAMPVKGVCSVMCLMPLDTPVTAPWPICRGARGRFSRELLLRMENMFLTTLRPYSAPSAARKSSSEPLWAGMKRRFRLTDAPSSVK
mmetsp:Transcript_24973/g.79320  ORF Transcript_24973/g.79320 Transcript_24973/m.79320 type:complete len:211 (-) Transcript_24973:1057-1689(-)